MAHSQPTSRTRKLVTLSMWSELMGMGQSNKAPRNQESIHQSNARQLQLSAPDSISLVGMVYDVMVRGILLSRKEQTVPNGMFQ